MFNEVATQGIVVVEVGCEQALGGDSRPLFCLFLFYDGGCYFLEDLCKIWTGFRLHLDDAYLRHLLLPCLGSLLQPLGRFGIEQQHPHKVLTRLGRKAWQAIGFEESGAMAQPVFGLCLAATFGAMPEAKVVAGKN